MTDEERLAEILGEWQERSAAGESPIPPSGSSGIRTWPTSSAPASMPCGSSTNFGSMSPWTTGRCPTRLHEYRLIREVGRGGMGVVYEAEQDIPASHRRTRRSCIPAITDARRRSVKRFLREARATAKLHHTNIVSVHSLAEEHGTWFYAMDLVRGRSLDQILAACAHEGRGHNAPIAMP